MGMLARILGVSENRTDSVRKPDKVERRSSPSSWDLMRLGVDGYGAPVGPHLAENLSAVYSCIQAISETTACLPLCVFRKEGDAKYLAPDQPVARLFSRAPNPLQTPVEFLE